MFPISMRGRIRGSPYSSARSQFMLGELEKFLTEEGYKVHVFGESVRFSGASFFKISMKHYFPSRVDGGVYYINSADQKFSISYKLSTIRMAVVPCALVLFLSGFLFSLKDSPVSEALATLAIGWFLIAGGNYLILWLKNRQMLRSVLRAPCRKI